MKANELRIGNWLNHDGIFRQVSSLHSDNTLRFKDGNSSIGCFKATLSNIKPIPLTEEILLKCGYEINFLDFNHFYKLHNLYLDSNFQPIDTFITYEIKYLHQLQNLYFALTNQELNIEL
jgi:hypothetical protein